MGKDFDLTFTERTLHKVGLNSWATSRMLKRMEFEATRTYFKGASKGRSTGGWQDNKATDPNTAWKADADIMKKRARGLFDSNGYGRRVSTALVDNMIGEQIQTQITVDWFPDWRPESQDQIKLKHQYNLQYNSQIEEEKKMWAEVADIEGKLEWGDMQRLTAQTAIIDGECLKQTVFKADERFPLKYKIMRAERLAATDYVQGVSANNEVINGIEYDGHGAPVAYHIEENSYRMKTNRIPAQYIKHTYRQDYPEQGRGFTWYAPIIPDLNDLINVNNYALIARKVQSAVALVVSKKKDSKGVLPGLGASTGTTENGLANRFITPGMIHDAGDSDVHSHIPTPSSDLDPLSKLMLRGVAVGIGMSYELLAGDYRDTTFAGGRLAKVDSDRHFDGLHTWYIRKDEKHCHRDFIDAQVLTGSIRSQSLNGRRIDINKVNLYKASFSRRKQEWGVNPLQEVKAVVELIRSKASTYRKELEGRGTDFDDHLKQLANESDLWDEAFNMEVPTEEAPDIKKEDEK